MIRELFGHFFHQSSKQFKNISFQTLIRRTYRTSSILYDKNFIDYSRVPTLDENDLEEQMVRGSGPGGQAVNKTNNCVVLKHKPTGIVVKCHLHRMANWNRKEARRLLVMRLDNQINGESSIENQMKHFQMKKSSEKTRRQKKADEMKKKWKKREQFD